MAQRHICTFVDWENIRISLQQNFLPFVGPTAIAAELKKLVEETGEWRGGFAYADWTKQKSGAHAFEDAGFHAKMVLPKRSGTDRSDMTMSLDILETIVAKADEVDTIVLASGDSDFQDIIRRAKDKGIYTLVVGVAPTTAAGIISLADQYVAIESRMALKPRGEIEMEHTPPDRDWTDFVRFLADLEQTNKYVGIRKLVDEWMAAYPHLYGESRERRRSYLKDAETEAIAGIYRVPALPSGKGQAAAVRLNREHPVVVTVLKPEGDPPEGAQDQDEGAEPAPQESTDGGR